MVDNPDWGFTSLGAPTRWVLGHGLATRTSAPTTPLDESDWARLRSECRAHRLEGHLIAAVTDGTLPHTPAQRAEVAALEIEAAGVRSRYDQVCGPVLDSLERAGIRVRLIKGSALPWTDYPDPQLRPTADLDILVPGVQLYDTVECLVAQGGRVVNPEPVPDFAKRVFKGLTVAMPSGLEVDVHRLLSWGPFGVRVPEADLWAPGRTFDRLGRPAVTLDVERTLLHVSAHLLLLGAIRASEVRDVAQVASSPELDVDRVIAVARRWGHEAILAVAVTMAAHELALDGGTDGLFRWAAEHRLPVRDRAWLRTDRPDMPVRGVEPLTVLVELPGLRARLTMLHALVAPRPGTDPSLVSRLRHVLGSASPGRRLGRRSPFDSPERSTAR